MDGANYCNGTFFYAGRSSQYEPNSENSDCGTLCIMYVKWNEELKEERIKVSILLILEKSEQVMDNVQKLLDNEKQLKYINDSV